MYIYYKLILPFLPEYNNFKIIDTPGSGYFDTIEKIKKGTENEKFHFV